jgi:hypothetical protein
MPLGPVALAPDILPCTGPLISDLVGFLLCMTTAFVAALFSFPVSAVAWVYYRPAVGISLLCVAVTMLVLGAYFQRKHKTSRRLRSTGLW